MSIDKFKGDYTEDAFIPNLEDMVNHQDNFIILELLIG